MRSPLGPIFTFAMLAAMLLPASATPIRPDIRKLVSEPAENNIHFAPARAGWDGPEMNGNGIKFGNPAIERLTPAASARAVRASLVASLIPDWRILLSLSALILGLRLLRQRATFEGPQESKVVPAEERLRPAA